MPELSAHTDFTSRYGPIVRLGPVEIDCQSIDSLHKIYGTPFEKAEQYDFTSFDPVKDSRHLLAVRDKKEATKLRRILLPLFATANLKEMVPVRLYFLKTYFQLTSLLTTDVSQVSGHV